MRTDELLDKLGYTKSDNYLSQDTGAFDTIVDYGHLFRQAANEPCNLKGVYTLRQNENIAIPVVYVCNVETEAEAKDAHRLLWNQDTVPFLIINTPQTVRVYPGFCHEESGGPSTSVREIQSEFDLVPRDRIISTLSATAVDSGETWRSWGRFIRPEHKVDWRLLHDLRELDERLQQRGELARDVSHALIGKYVYLHYLRDRDILSDRKLEKFQIEPSSVFGRNATVDGLQSLLHKLDDWLNGVVFPLDFSRRGAPRNKHVARVAATFAGDSPLGENEWQLHLNFKAYDFSYIPIEVLSIVYEQFLHTPDEDSKKSRGRAAGAYYTPIPVVNLMLSEIEEHRPLRKGMRVFDPACGSGAFLVQAFRRLIEREFPPRKGRVNPIDLRKLLKEHFFGLDTDPDACNVARLSLILTLLDYVEPRDLEDPRRGRKPALPNLCENIFCANFFDDSGPWQRVFARKKADWIVGNPPWKQLKGKLREEDKPALEWIKGEKKNRPVGDRQLAQAFAWRVADYVADDGEIALFLPAMTLFEKRAKGFRSQFFREMSVHSLVNFSNMRHVISAGRFEAPAAAFFYHPRLQQASQNDQDESIRTYSPLVANQEATRPFSESKRKYVESWSIILNASEIRDISLETVLGGQSLPWKIAFWGSSLDARLIRSLQQRFQTIGNMEDAGLLFLKEGPHLRDGDPSDPPAGMLPVLKLLNKPILDTSRLKGLRDFSSFPDIAIKLNRKPLLRQRGGTAGLKVIQPPHVVVSAAGNFAVYTDDFIIVPSRQIGVISPQQDQYLLKALSVYLSSDVAFYFMFFLSTSLGVERDRSTLEALRRIPAPLMNARPTQLKAWARLHDQLAKATRDAYRARRLFHGANLPRGSVVPKKMMQELNGLVYDALGLGPREQSLIHDLLHVRCGLINGQVSHEVADAPKAKELQVYAKSLQKELDDYVGDTASVRHAVDIIHDDQSAMVCLTLARSTKARQKVSVMRADASEAKALKKARDRVRQQKSQWVYFDRNLRIYDGNSTYVLKPMQRFHWTRTQARLDAREIIAESILRKNA